MCFEVTKINSIAMKKTPLEISKILVEIGKYHKSFENGHATAYRLRELADIIDPETEDSIGVGSYGLEQS